MPACIVRFRTLASLVNIVGSACVALGIVVIDEISHVICMSFAPWLRLLFLDICCTVVYYAQISRMLATLSTMTSPTTAKIPPIVSVVQGSVIRAGLKGTSFTYFTTDKAKSARDLLAIFKEAKAEDPPQLEEMSVFGGSGGRSRYGGGRGGGQGGGYGGGGGCGYSGGGGRGYGGRGRGGGGGGGGYGGHDCW
ncbi:uncharacterized protein STEHIDRAFT_169360 [Stereum hirsutum FP-91666 SS1]|uniref:uncharacterized protein n=1 Tax=Stereum hirsutum (strain FP-91666) TaxID=721885 RepID=UPI0004449B5C|nr:uncharacterized protein STEHIDRAFT_169360 [Stereum hirsutum FP-91666 SS1]EIM85438.1 hypothetical protein STEHIDRAFT_169360 [Stereum hirsutum FP-91666 SS1]